MIKHVLFVAIYFTFCNCEHGHETLLNNVILAMERCVDYMVINKNSINIDALFAAVLAKSNLKHLISSKTHSVRLNDIEIKLVNVLGQIEEVTNTSAQNKLFGDTLLLTKAWERNITFKNNSLSFYGLELDTLSQFYQYISNSRLQEDVSDGCLKELLLQQPFCCREHQCVITEYCDDRMGLLDNQSLDRGYGVTHSLLYVQVARSQRCDLDEELLNEKIHKFCSYIYWELRKIEKFHFPRKLDDLVLEQVTLCGYEGFSEFLTLNIANHIMQIQHPLGCFGMESENVASLNQTRFKRESNTISEGCTDHATGLGASALSILLRYFLEE